MQHSLARQLLALLFLLALVAGGDRFAAIATDMDSGVQMGDMQQPDEGCKACGGTMSAAPCDVVCAALPAIGVDVIGVPEAGMHERWAARSESGADFSIRPDTSPPRA